MFTTKTRKPYWINSPLATEIAAMIERSPVLYGCSIDFLETTIRIGIRKRAAQ